MIVYIFYIIWHDVLTKERKNLKINQETKLKLIKLCEIYYEWMKEERNKHKNTDQRMNRNKWKMSMNLELKPKWKVEWR